MRVARRHFLALLAGSGTLLAARRPKAVAASRAGVPPVLIGSANGWYDGGQGRPEMPPIAVALAALRDPVVASRQYGLLEALVRGVGVAEDDPTEIGVGMGGLPNEDGVVQLDASVMFGPTHQCGSVAAIEDIQNPAAVALQVLRYTDHALLVGHGATEFALAMGHPRRDLRTDKARQWWLYWKQRLSADDDWLTPPDGEVPPEIRDAFTQGTIHMSGLSDAGELASVTTTSGLAFKIPGRVGDSPIIGAGNYCDGEVGTAGATGRGEEMIVSCGAHAIVEAMRRDVEPAQACVEFLEQVVVRAGKRGLLDDKGRPTFGLTVYALRRDGVHGSASLFEGTSYAVADAQGGPRHESCASLFPR